MCNLVGKSPLRQAWQLAGTGISSKLSTLSWTLMPKHATKTSLQKGHKPSPNSGRKKGVTLVTISKLRELCLQAIEELGDNDEGRNGALGYIKKFAKEERKTFMGSIVSRMIPQQIRADVNHEFDADTALAAIEHSINGLLSARRAKNVTPQITGGATRLADEDVAVLVETRAKSA